MTSIVAMGLDQSPRHTGWAIGKPDERPIWGVFELLPWGDQEGRRLCAMENFLLSKLAEYRVTDLFIETPVDPRTLKYAKNNFETVEHQLMLKGCIAMAANRSNVPVQQVAISSWRSRLLGTTKPPPGLKGDHARKALKQMALKACALRGWLVDDDNAAEALGILDYSLSTLSTRHAGKTDVLFRRAELNADRARFQGEGG